MGPVPAQGTICPEYASYALENAEMGKERVNPAAGVTLTYML